MFDAQYVTGCMYFKNKKEKDSLWRQLKRELGDKVRIWKEDNYLFYRYKDAS